MTFGLVYAFSEKFVLPLSHDEVVYGKGSLIGKMPGDDWQSFANLRAYFGFMWTHPGQEAAVHGRRVRPGAGVEPRHRARLAPARRPAPCRRAAAGARSQPRSIATIRALHARDCEPGRLPLGGDRRPRPERVRLSALRRRGDAPVLVVCNFTPVPRHGYRIGVPRGGAVARGAQHRRGVYGGSNVGNGGAGPAPRTMPRTASRLRCC